ncbi:SDR family oxidoreductase [Yinghuangia aomiensis]
MGHDGHRRHRGPRSTPAAARPRAASRRRRPRRRRQGIGRQAAHALAQAGARVLAADLDPDLADDIAKEVDGIAWSATPRRVPTSRRWQRAEATLGRVHAVVDIIGMSKYQDLLSVTDEDWTWHQDIVLRHALLALQYGGAHMARHAGRSRSSRRCRPERRTDARGVRRGEGRADVAGPVGGGGTRPSESG